MEIDQQVVSLDLAIKLEKLGVKQESVWYWVYAFPTTHLIGLRTSRGHLVNHIVEDKGNMSGCSIITGGKPISAFTVAELGVLLPELCLSGKASEEGYNCWWFEEMCMREINNYNSYQSVKEADARAIMLIWLIENGRIQNETESKDGGK